MKTKKVKINLLRGRKLRGKTQISLFFLFLFFLLFITLLFADIIDSFNLPCANLSKRH